MCTRRKIDLMRRINVCAMALALILGCGGEMQEGPPGVGGNSGESGKGGGSQDSGKEIGGGGSTKSRLGDCKPGTPMNKARECPWYADQTCYSTKEAACNCICPLDVAEVYCASWLPEEGVPTEVYCYEG
jgi:hypothetical protein